MSQRRSVALAQDLIQKRVAAGDHLVARSSSRRIAATSRSTTRRRPSASAAFVFTGSDRRSRSRTVESASRADGSRGGESAHAGSTAISLGSSSSFPRTASGRRASPAPVKERLDIESRGVASEPLEQGPFRLVVHRAGRRPGRRAEPLFTRRADRDRERARRNEVLAGTGSLHRFASRPLGGRRHRGDAHPADRDRPGPVLQAAADRGAPVGRSAGSRRIRRIDGRPEQVRFTVITSMSTARSRARLRARGRAGDGDPIRRDVRAGEDPIDVFTSTTSSRAVDGHSATMSISTPWIRRCVRGP